jgi:hypothetical protein
MRLGAGYAGSALVGGSVALFFSTPTISYCIAVMAVLVVIPVFAFTWRIPTTAWMQRKRNVLRRRPSAASKKPQDLSWSEHPPECIQNASPSRSQEAAFLRSFDRMEEILQQALALQVGGLAKDFDLRDTVMHLQKTGFLTSRDRTSWSDCLRVRKWLLLADHDRPPPARVDVERAYVDMTQLQVALIDRKRELFTEEQKLREQEDLAMREYLARTN